MFKYTSQMDTSIDNGQDLLNELHMEGALLGAALG